MKNKKLYCIVAILIIGIELGSIILKNRKAEENVKSNNISQNLENTSNIVNDIKNEISNKTSNTTYNVINNTENTIVRKENKSEIPLFETNTTSVVSKEAFDNGHLKKYPEYRTTIWKFIY